MRALTLALLLAACHDDHTVADAAMPDAGLADPSDELYAADRLPRFDLTLSEASIAALAADPYTYVAGDLTYGDETAVNIGVRLKGTTSFRPIDQKPSFKLKFDQMVGGQRFRGLKRMVLNNSVKDPSFLAETVAYRVFRAGGVPAPRANHALVYVNGAYYGVYVNVEAEDKTFLRRWFADDSGSLYESDFDDVTGGSADEFDLETNEELNDRSDLAALLAAAGATTPDTLLDDMSPTLDTGEWLRYWALEYAVLQRDGYAFLLWGDDQPGNFRLYHDPESGRFHLIPWSMDRAMKPPHMPLTASYAHLTWTCLEGEACTAAIQQVVVEIANLWDSLPLADEAAAASDWIAPWVELDTRRPTDVSFADGVAQVQEAIATQSAAMRADTAGSP